MEKVSVSHFANICGVSGAAVRKLIMQEKLSAEKDPKGNYILSLNCDKNKAYIETHKNHQTGLQKPEEPVAGSCDTVTGEVIVTLLAKLETLAKEAGQAKLLTDSVIQKKKDIEYWREKYFELQYQNNELHNLITRLRNENETISNELQQLRQKRFSLAFWKKN